MARVRHHLARPSRPGRVEAMLPWGVVLVGVGVMIGLMISILVVPVSYTSRLGLPDLEFARPSPPVPPATPPAAGEAGDGEKDRLALRDVAAVRYSPTPSPTPSPSPSSPPPPPETTDPAPDPFLSGTYEVEQFFGDAFISKVAIKNESFQSRDWTVELEFASDDVGRMNTFWVDGTPQPVLQRSGERFVFTSTVPVPGGSWVVLKLHFDRDGFGWDLDPTLCRVNGGDCLVRSR